LSELLEQLHKEDEEYFEEFHEPVSAKELSPEDILGFKLHESIVYVPGLHCPLPVASIYSLLPLYDSVIFPITSKYEGKKIENEEKFREIHVLSPDEITILARKGRIVPHFMQAFTDYDYNIVEPILEPGVPRISAAQSTLISYYGFCNIVQKDCDECKRQRDMVDSDYPELSSKDCSSCLAMLYNLGYREEISRLDSIIPQVCMAREIIISRNLNSVFQTHCPAGNKSLNMISGLPEESNFEFIVNGLGLNYVEQITLEDYVDVIDSKTTKAIRKIVSDLLKDPLTKKYQHRLSSKIYDFNQQVEELSERKTTNIYKAVSDMVTYGGSKFIERQTSNYVKLPQVGIKKGAEWIASKVVDIHSWLIGKDWTVAQIYRTKCKLDKCVEQAR